MPKKVFLGDGSAFTLNYKKLYEIISLIKEYLPSVEIINCDATISSVKNKSDDELKNLKELGLTTLYIGIESGLNDVLEFMDKDHNTNEAIDQIERLKKVGIDFGAHIMTGIAGCGRSFENAKATADFLNLTKPKAIINFSLFIESDLIKDIELNKFNPASELENLMEEKALLEHLDFNESDNIKFSGYHDFIHFATKGILPKDRNLLIMKLEKEIEKYKKLEDVFSNKDLMIKKGLNPKGYGFLDKEFIGLEDVYIKK